MYAIIEESGGQRKVVAGDELVIDLLDGGEAATGQAVVFDRVLFVGGAEGVTRIGRPLVEGATVTAEVIDPVVMGEKIRIYKHRPKKTYKRKTGHRQRYTRVRVTAINA
ncbi:MAG TPA: 50S ribosomal protein L21 [Phycisphaerales bacterium]|nr:50S ribosomal protein L21 [Phycisphaerales bacterium]